MQYWWYIGQQEYVYKVCSLASIFAFVADRMFNDFDYLITMEDPIVFMMTSSNGNIFRATGHLCGEFTAQRPVVRSFDVFFDLRLNKRLRKQSWGWWFDTLSCP